MAPFRIVIDRDACVGDGHCREIAGNTFDIDCEDCCVVIDPDGDPPEDILRAARECLVGAIKLFDARTGEPVLPHRVVL